MINDDVKHIVKDLIDSGLLEDIVGVGVRMIIRNNDKNELDHGDIDRVWVYRHIYFLARDRLQFYKGYELKDKRSRLSNVIAVNYTNKVYNEMMSSL